MKKKQNNCPLKLFFILLTKHFNSRKLARNKISYSKNI